MIKVSRRQFMKTTALAASVSVGSRFARAANPEDVLSPLRFFHPWLRKSLIQCRC
jgi:hypothetical protein